MRSLKIIISLMALLALGACGGGGSNDSSTNKDLGVGPIKSIKLDPINQDLAAEGKSVFKAKCSSCHKISKKYIGPALKGVTQRREPEWIMNMILSPDKMIAENDTAKALLGKYLAPMANQNLSEKEARAILEYFRLKDSK